MARRTLKRSLPGYDVARPTYPTANASLGTSGRPLANLAWTAAQVYEISASMVAVSKNGYALQAPGSGSHAYGYASAAYPGIKLDIDGQIRSSGVVGADDYSSGVAEYRNKPLTALDVGRRQGRRRRRRSAAATGDGLQGQTILLEFLLERGAIDMIVDRRQMRPELVALLALLLKLSTDALA